MSDQNSLQALQLISAAWSNSTLPLVATAEALLRGEEIDLPSIEGRYVEGAEVGRGGLGRVISVYDKRLGRQVALKEKLKDGPNAEARFFQEAIVTAQLEHPSIIPIYDFGRKRDGAICYTMKLVSGKTLSELINKSPLLSTRMPLLRHVLSICEAVAYAHTRSIIHRDLKPQNILIGEFGETMLIDWGLAKKTGASPSLTPALSISDNGEGPDGLTKEGTILGTPAYMPPEQAQGKEVDARADVYSLGAILYHVISGKTPYPKQSSRDLIATLLKEPPPPLEKVAPLASKDLVSIVNKAMERDPQERYETAKELADDLKSFLAGQMVAARSYSLSDRLYRFLQKYRLVVFLWAALLIGFMSVATFIYSNILIHEELEECRRATNTAAP